MSHPMHSKRSPYLLSALLTLALGSSAAGQSTTIPLDSRAAFVHVNSDNAPNAVPISLAALGVGPGQCLRLREVGAYDPGPGGDTVTLTIGVFSSSSTLLAGSQLHRVPGAIDAGVDVLTATTFFGNQATDIDEDFSIASDDFSEVTVRVPPGAAYLFVCPTDHYFVDNSDPNGDYGVNITVVGCWTDLGQGPARAERRS